MNDLISGLREKAEFHRKRAEYWEGVLAEAEKESAPAKAPKKAQKSTTPVGQATSFGEFKTRREYIRDLINRRPGLTRTEMRKIAVEEGVPLVASFPYEQVTKLLDDDEIKQSGDKLFPKNKATSTAA